MSDESDNMLRAISAMTSLPQWPDFVEAFKERRRQWLEDSKSPAVYQNHAELVAVTARAAENDHWITIFGDAQAKASEPTGPG